MISARVRVACLIAAGTAELLLWRAHWTADTRNHQWLQTLRVHSGQQLSLERSEDKPDQPIVDYQTPAGHSHRVRISMKRGRLSEQSQAAFRQVGLPAPKGDGVLEIAPDPKFEQIRGPECKVG